MWSVTCKNDNSACLNFLIMSPNSYFYFFFGLFLNNHLKYINDNLKDYRTRSVSCKNKDSAFLRHSFNSCSYSKTSFLWSFHVSSFHFLR